MLFGAGMAGVYFWLSQWHCRTVLYRRKVVVNATNGRTFAGVVWEDTGRWVVLRNAEMIEPRGERVPVDGEVVIDRDLIEFVQVP